MATQESLRFTKKRISVFEALGVEPEYASESAERLGLAFAFMLRQECTDRALESGSVWAEKFRVLGNGIYSGDRYRFARTPYLREIADVMAKRDPERKVVVVAKATQQGGSESVVNEVLRRIHREGGNVLFYAENDEKAKERMTESFDVMLAREPFSRLGLRKVSNKLRHPGGTVYFRGVQKGSNLASNPAGLVVGDEAARYPRKIEKEGDFLTLARGRINTYGDEGKILMVSTFIDDYEGDGSFYSAYISGDQHEYFCPCPHCGEFYIWDEEYLVVEGDDVAMKCPVESCGGLTHDNQERAGAMARGEWRPTAERARFSDLTSYRINGFLSMDCTKSWAEMYRQIKDAESGRGLSMQALHNTVLAKPWSEMRGRRPASSEAEMKMKSLGYKAGEIPPEVVFLTAGIDVQKTHFDMEVKGWDRNLNSYSVKREKIPLAIEETEARDVAARIKPHLDDGVGGFPIRLCCIDSGHWGNEIRAAFLTKHKDLPKFTAWQMPVTSDKASGAVILTKGRARDDALLLALPGMKKTRTGQLSSKYYALLGVDYAKNIIYRTLASDYGEEQDPTPEGEEGAETQGKTVSKPDRKPKPRTGRMYAPDDYAAEYFKEITAEEMHIVPGKYSGMRIAFSLPHGGIRNEALDLAVMNMAAMEICGALDYDARRWEKLMRVADGYRKAGKKKKSGGPEGKPRELSAAARAFQQEQERRKKEWNG